MLTKDQAEKIIALAGVMSARRVRKFAVSKKIGGPRETAAGTTKGFFIARQNLENYVESLTQASQFEAQNGNRAKG